MKREVAVIFNPFSKSGRNWRHRKKLNEALKTHFSNAFSIYETQFPGHATEMAQKLVESDVETIIAAGGDGTINEVVNGILMKPESSCHLGIVNLGSGGDLARSLRLPKKIMDQVQLISSAKPKRIDIGKLECSKEDGNPFLRYFINECQVGISGAIVNEVSSWLKKNWGAMAFKLVSVIQIFSYKATNITFEINQQPQIQLPALGVVLANGRYCGGGMKLTPKANFDDGFLDLVVIGEMNIPSRLYYFASMLINWKIRSNKILRNTIRTIQIQSDPPVLVEVDGELIGLTPVRISLVAHNLKILF